MDRFRRDVKLIEDEANSFINESFENLRSAEGAFDMLHNFKHIQARSSINETMMRKFDEILEQYGKEVRQRTLTVMHTSNSSSYKCLANIVLYILLNVHLPLPILQVDAINQLFRDHKDNPPISLNQPPVAGAITWSRALFKRIKHTVVRLRTMKELINTAKGKQVCV